MIRIYFSLFLGIVFSNILFADIITVPADYSSIQTAVDSAQVGDTVLISQNTYVENIVIDKDIILTSNYIFDHDSNSIKNTIIDGDSVDTVIGIDYGVSQNMRVQYLTITNGYSNQLNLSTRGAGLRVEGDAIILGNIIEYNHTVDGYGGGLHVSADSAIIYGNIIRYNSAVDSTGGFASGGGISAGGCEIINNKIYGNWASSRGGGVYGARYYLKNNLIYNNSCNQWGGGVMINIGDTWISNNVIVNNMGDGIYGWSTSPTYTVNIYIKNNVVYGNSGNGYTASGRVTTHITNSILYNNYGTEIFNQNFGIFDVNYCNVEAGFDSGIGIIDTNSFFMDTTTMNFQLMANSSLIDAGNPDPAYNDICFPPSLGGVRNDIGAYGGPDACGWLDSTIAPTVIENEISKEKIANSFSLEQNYPNPFNPTTNIQYNIPKSSHVKIEVFNMIGQKIITLFDGYKNMGNHKIQFNANGLASGVYLYKLETAGFSQIRKMILLR